MSIKKVKSGWQVDFRPSGRDTPRLRKTFVKKFDAEQFFTREKAKAQINADYSRPKVDKRRLSDLVNDWYKLHGASLKDGRKRFSKLEGLVERLDNPLAGNLTPENWLEYRNQRITEFRRNSDQKLVSKNNLNHEHTYLCAVYNQLIKLGNWKQKNPMAGIPKFVIDESEPEYLELDQIDALLDACSASKSPELYLRVKLCLHTGARWGEAGAITGMQLRAGKAFFTKTKNSQSRGVPIALDFQEELLQGKPPNGAIFKTDPKKAFYTAVKMAGIALPSGQATHILRHSYASHYMIADGNLLKLQKALGHKDIKQTLRYAHLAPKHLAESLDKNPLAQLTGRHKVSTKCPQKGAAAR